MGHFYNLKQHGHGRLSMIIYAKNLCLLKLVSLARSPIGDRSYDNGQMFPVLHLMFSALPAKNHFRIYLASVISN